MTTITRDELTTDHAHLLALQLNLFNEMVRELPQGMAFETMEFITDRATAYRISDLWFDTFNGAF